MILVTLPSILGFLGCFEGTGDEQFPRNGLGEAILPGKVVHHLLEILISLAPKAVGGCHDAVLEGIFFA